MKYEQIFVYTETNNLKKQIFDLEQATIALGQGASEDQKDAARPTQSKTDSSGCFGIYPFHLKGT
jgi:hypothetical protein